MDNKIIKKEALNFLKSQNTMVIATVSSDLEPEAANVYFYTEDNFNFYFVCSKKSKKAENLKNNGKTAFVVGRGPEIITIQGGGIAKELPDKDAQIFYELVKKSAMKTVHQFPVINFSDEGFYVFRITPSYMTCLNMEKDKNPDIASPKFYKII